MIEAALLIGLGALLTKLFLMPLQDALAERQKRLDRAKAEVIAARIREQAEEAARGAGG